MAFCIERKYQYFADGTLNFDTRVDVSGVEKGTKQASNAFTAGMAGAAKAAASDIGSIFANAFSVFLGNAMTGAASQITTLGKDAIAAGESFEAEMSKVQAISGAAGEDFARLTEKAKEMGRTTSFSASESAEAFEYMAMAGWKTDDMLNSIEGVMNLAAASGESLGSVSDIVTDAMTAFGLAADGMTNGISNATHFADVLAAASSNANTNVGMMGETFKYVAPVAGALGFSIEDTATAIGLMANAGIKGSQAGTALRSLFSRLSKPTKEVQGAMDQLGLSITNSDGTMKSLAEITQDLRTAFSGLGEAERAQVAAALAGQEAMSGLLAIVSASDSDFNKLTGAIDNANGTAANMAGTMLDNVAGSKKIFESAMEGLSLAIYDYMQGPLKQLYGWGADAVSRLTAGLQGGGLSGLFKAAEGIVQEVIAKFQSKLPALLAAGKRLVLWIARGIQQAIPALLKAAADILPKVIGVIQRALPGILKAAAAIIKAVIKRIQQAIPGIIEAIKKAIPRIVKAVKDAAPKLLKAAGDVLKKAQGTITDLTPKLIKGAKGLLDNIVSYVKEHGPDIIKAAADAMMNRLYLLGDLAKGISEALPGIIEAAGKVFRSLISYITEHKEEIFEAFKNTMAALGDIGGTLWEALKEALSFVWEGIKGFWDEHGEEIINGAIDLLQQAWRAIQEHGPEIIAILEGLFFDLLNWLLTKAPDLINAVGQIISDLIAALPSMMDGVANEFGQLMGKAAAAMDEHGGEIMKATEDAVAKITETIGKKSPDIITKAGEIVEWIGSGILEKLPDLVKAAGEVVLTFLKNITAHLPDIIEAGVIFLGHFIAGIIRAIPALLKAIGEAVAAVIRIMTEIDWKKLGNACIVALGKGMLGALDTIIDAFNDFFNWIGNGLAKIGAIEYEDQGRSETAKKPRYDAYKNSDDWITWTPDEQAMRDAIMNVGALDTSEAVYNARTGQQFEVDYERMGQEMQKAMAETKVEIDGRNAGQIMAPYVNRIFSKEATAEKRGAR